MNIRRGLLMGTAALVAGAATRRAGAQRLPRVGILGLSAPAQQGPLMRAMVDGLREHGFVDGRNVTLEYRWASGSLAALPALAAELAALPVDVFVAGNNNLVQVAREASATIPIVMVLGGRHRAGGRSDPACRGTDPVRDRRRGNLFRACAPGRARAAAPNDAEHFKPLACELATRKGNVFFADAPIRAHQAKHVALCLKRRLPLVWSGGVCIDATLIDKRHGSTQLELAVNRKGARALGITIPYSVPVSADEVIE